MSGGAWVVETSADRFAADVIDRSHELPVVVDFWAEWCHPCRLLAPVLEKLAGEAAGQFLLVKANVDELPAIAAQFGVQGIPAVFGLRDGQIVDSFAGVLSEAQVRRWLEGMLPTSAERLVAQGRALAQADPAAAAECFRAALAEDPELAAAKIELAGCLLALRKHEEARELIEQLQRRGYLEPQAEALRAKLELAEQSAQAGDLEALRRRVADNPADGEAQLRLAEGLAGIGQYADALELCLAVVTANQGPLRDAARERMVDIFHALGPESELVHAFQRKLSLALY